MMSEPAAKPVADVTTIDVSVVRRAEASVVVVSDMAGS
jgi:hypothetical protein